MQWWTRARSLFGTLFKKSRLNADLDTELRSYIDLLVDEKVQAGIPEAEARRQARLELGGVDQVKAEVADRRIGARIDAFAQDVRFAGRQFRRNPGFTVVAVVTLALGIGANTAVFSVVNQVLLRPLPYADEDRVVVVRNTHVDGPLELSEQELIEYAALDQFESLGAYTFGTFALSGEGEAERLRVVFADAAVLPSLGTPLLAGRLFDVAEDTPGGDRVVLLSEAMWERRFARDPSVLGREIVLNGIPRTVIGVLPEGFRLPDGFAGPAPDIVSPLRLDRTDPDARNLHYLNAVARLGSGVPIGQARVSLDAAARRIFERLGTLPETFSATAIPVRTDVVGSVRPALLILLGAVGLVLLVACVNIANLLLARSDARLREMAVRVSLGAGNRRLVRQLCTETAVLALAGGVTGLGLGAVGARALVALSPPGLPRLDGATIDIGMFAFCLLATLTTGLLIGLLPALRLSRDEPVNALKGTHRSTSGASGVRTRRSLVTAQVALAAMLTIGAGLLVRSLAELRAVDPGFDDSGVLTFQVALPSGEYPDSPTARRYFDALEERVAAIPGVERVGATTGLPLASSVGDWGVRIRGRGPDGLGEQGPGPDWMVVTPGYFETLRIPVMEGRGFDTGDSPGALQAVVISREFADRHWPDGDALGAQLRMTTNIDTLWRTVVGITADVHQTSLDEAPRPTMYLPNAQFPSTTEDVVVRQFTMTVRAETGGAAAVTGGVRAAAASLDPNVPVANVRTLEDVTRAATATETFQGLLFGAFAVMALVLVIVGVYGVTAYLVARRTREIGIRIALGASPRGVGALVLREGLAMTAIGLVVGVSGAWMLSRLMAGLLYGVTARDTVTFVAVPLILGVTALVSAAVPAVRAARVDPQEALRFD